MAYETKVILKLLAQSIGKAKDVEECYDYIVEAANVEGMKLPSYEEYQRHLEEKGRK